MPEAVAAPSDALARWNLDLLALVPAADYVALLTYPQAAQSEEALAELVGRAVQLAGGAERVMVKVALIDRPTGRRLPDAQVARFLSAVHRDHLPSVVYLYNSGAIHQLPQRHLPRPSRLD